MNKYIRQFTFSLWPVLLLLGGLIAVTSYKTSPWYVWSGFIAAGLLDGAIWLWLETKASKSSAATTPHIRMCFNGQEFVLEDTRDMGDHCSCMGT
jgi:hypothetical protein